MCACTYHGILYESFLRFSDKFDYHGMAQANPFVGPVSFLLYTMMINFVFVNFFFILINDGIAAVQDDLSMQDNDYEIVEFMVDRFKKLFGKGQTTRPLERRQVQHTYIEGRFLLIF